MLELSMFVKKSNIVLFRGVIKEKIGFIVTEPQVVKEEKYDVIPRRFTTFGDHPKSLNLNCWWCGLPIKRPPCFIPVNIEIVNDLPECDINHVFNSWRCAIAYAQKFMLPSQQWDISTGISIFSSIFEKNGENYSSLAAQSATSIPAAYTMMQTNIIMPPQLMLHTSQQSSSQAQQAPLQQEQSLQITTITPEAAKQRNLAQLTAVTAVILPAPPPTIRKSFCGSYGVTDDQYLAIIGA